MTNMQSTNGLQYNGPFRILSTGEKVSQQVHVVGKPLVYGKPIVYAPLPKKPKPACCPFCKAEGDMITVTWWREFEPETPEDGYWNLYCFGDCDHDMNIKWDGQ